MRVERITLLLKRVGLGLAARSALFSSSVRSDLLLLASKRERHAHILRLKERDGERVALAELER